METTELLREKIESYYTKYYRDTLNLRDWKTRVRERLCEEEFEVDRLTRIRQILNIDFRGKKVLVVGVGTGSVVPELHKQGAEVYGIDPARDAIEIVQLKCHQHNIPRSRFIPGCAEGIPYPENYFDFIYCFAVLEHVNCVRQSLLNMIRVVKKNCYIYLLAADYRSIYENHYKTFMVSDLIPGWVTWNKLWLLYEGRNPSYFLHGGVNHVDFRDVQQVLIEQDVTFFRTYWNLPERWRDKHLLQHLSIYERLRRWMYMRHGIGHNFEIFILKNSFRG